MLFSVQELFVYPLVVVYNLKHDGTEKVLDSIVLDYVREWEAYECREPLREVPQVVGNEMKL